jgi:hypothetical protein
MEEKHKEVNEGIWMTINHQNIWPKRLVDLHLFALPLLHLLQLKGQDTVLV